MKAQIIVCFLLLFVFGSLRGFETHDPHMTITEPPAKKSTIYGLTFGEDPLEISKSLAKQGCRLKTNDSPDGKGIIKVITFSPLPDSLSPNDGELRLVFFKNELIRADFIFEPSYLTFLAIRENVLNKLGPRFHLNEEKTAMEDLLKTRLAHLEDGQYDATMEAEITQSLLKGKTFFYYRIGDRQNELNIAYSFQALGTPEHRSPRLQLHYSLKKEMEDLREFQHMR